MKKHLDWAAVKAAAHQLGVKPRTVEKWQEADRGVPHKWWLPIVRAADGRVTLEALERSRE
jgi:DNA-binding transcriptional regulator YdaS (Cro superfamily)